MPQADVTKMKVADLKRELKLRGLITTGNKTELQDRLQTALLEGELSLEDTAISGEDLLDEDGVLTDEEEAKILGADENELLHSPTTDLGLSKPTSILSGISEERNELNTSTSSQASGGRKIILKRKSSFNANLSSVEAPLAGTKENNQPIPAKVVKLSEHTPITIESEKSSEKEVKISSKISQLTLQQRLEMRAKKFGINNAEKPKGTPANPVTNDSTASSSGDTTQIDILKKRAERFGCVLSSKVAKLDAEEKLLKRKQRFGGVDSSTANGTKSSDPDAWAEKARLRLERFGSSTQTTTVQANHTK